MNDRIRSLFCRTDALSTTGFFSGFGGWIDFFSGFDGWIGPSPSLPSTGDNDGSSSTLCGARIGDTVGSGARIGDTVGSGARIGDTVGSGTLGVDGVAAITDSMVELSEETSGSEGELVMESFSDDCVLDGRKY